MAKTNSFVNAELDFAEAQLESWRKYIEANPIDTLEDRWGKKEMPKGGQTFVVVATKEQILKSIQDTMEKYLKMLEVVDKLREKEEQKIEARGSQEINGKMKRFS
jgi:hypothetical protein